MQEFSITTNDNSDAWDMSPPSTVIPDDGISIPSPYKALWNNEDLDAWLFATCGDSNEAPGSSADGNWDYSAGPGNGVRTRGLKINEACRRLYQKVAVTSGTSYTLIMESRSEAASHPSEVYILNTEIVDEIGFSSTSSTVDAFLNITNDFSSSKSNADTDNFTVNSLEFTPSGSFIVIYIKSPNTIGSSDEVFYDNIRLFETGSLSTEDAFASNFKAFPNPASDFVTIQSKNIKVSSVDMYNVVGAKVLSTELTNNNRVNVSSLVKGVYFMKINAEGGRSTTKKIVVQ